jgi:hypothetical protein
MMAEKLFAMAVAVLLCSLVVSLWKEERFHWWEAARCVKGCNGSLTSGTDDKFNFVKGIWIE